LEDVATPRPGLRSRSNPSTFSYSTPKLQKKTPSKYSKAGKKKLKEEQRILRSDAVDDLSQTTTSNEASKPVVVKQDTARARVREEIATKTKAKRDAYLLHHKEHFMPLLPETNYITKLEESGEKTQSVIPHQRLLTQPQG